jgi:hypothetical protein
MTALICDPTADFLTWCIFCSLAVSSENLTAGAGADGLAGAGLGAAYCWCFVVADAGVLVAAMTERLAWHLSCCSLNLLSFSLRSIAWELARV